MDYPLDKFQYKEDGNWYPYFSHKYNCDCPMGNGRTERTVELSLANYWLDKVNSVCEVGAVTPYYWPGRVQEVVDPFDTHELVTSHNSLFDCDFTGKNVLSMSTVEHIGSGEYLEQKTTIDALMKIVPECKTCLITAPIGYNKDFDEYILNNELDLDCTVRFITRKRSLIHDIWVPTSKSKANIRMGRGAPPDDDLGRWANSLVIVQKGNILS